MRIEFFLTLSRLTGAIANGFWYLSTVFQNATLWLLKYAVVCPHGKNASQHCRDCDTPPFFGDDNV